MTTWINVKLLDPTCKPERKTAGAVGYDLVARVPVTIPPGKVGKVLTGVCLELRPGDEAQVRPRSGLSLRGIVGVVGTVDSDYRGEVGCLLHNTTGEPFAVEAGDRVAQIVFSRVLLPTLTVRAELGVTDRGEGGFGSTGLGVVGLCPACANGSWPCPLSQRCPSCGLDMICTNNTPCAKCGLCWECHGGDNGKSRQKHEYRR